MGKKYRFMLCVFMCMIFCYGCGRATSDEIGMDYQTEETASGGNAENESPEMQNGHTNFEISGAGDSNIVVDADIIGQEKLKSMHIYDVEHPEINDAYIKSEAETFFDKDSYAFYKPYSYCDAQELEQMRNDLSFDHDAETEPVKKQGLEKEIAVVELWMDNNTEKQNAQLTGDALYEEEFADGYHGRRAFAKGEIDGMPFVYEYADSFGPDDADFYGEMDLVRYDYIGEEQHVMRMSEEVASQMQDYSVSEESAIEQADAFLERIGYTGYTCQETGYAENTAHLSEQEELSYSWFLVYSVDRDGLEAVSCPGSILRHTLSDELQTGSENLYVLVNEDGVTRVMRTGTFYLIADEGTKLESYLAWEQIEDAAGQYLKTYELPVGHKSLTISRVSLSYVCVHYKSGQYCMIPVWSFYGASGTEGEHFIFGVSAVDGEIITGDYLMSVSDAFVL